jgi:hypothetical protein
MNGTTRRRLVRGGVGAIIILGVLAFFAFAWQPLVRFVIVSTVAQVGHVHLALGKTDVTLGRATLDDLRITSWQGEPIATIDRLRLDYDLREMFGKNARLFGLQRIEVDRPRVTIIRHADETYNIPVPKPQPSNAKQSPLIARVRVNDGSIEVIDRSRTGSPTPLYAQRINVDADVSAAALSRYTMSLAYGEQLQHLDALRGSGQIDMRDGYNDQHWTSAQLPVAGAIDFAINSPSVHLTSGTLRTIDLRIFSLPSTGRGWRAHLAASGYLAGGAGSLAALNKPIYDMHGPLVVSEHGLLTPSASATVNGVNVRLSGGVIDLTNPQFRMALSGNANLTQLRALFAQAQHLPVSGPIDFSMLAQGRATAPQIWLAFHSPTIDYNRQIVTGTSGLVAVGNTEADIVGVSTHHGAIALTARGRVAFRSQPNAIQMLLAANAPSSAIPYATSALPPMQLGAVAVATANDLKTIAAQGLLTGASPAQTLDATFNIASNGSGTLGPVYTNGASGSLYTRVALNQPHGTTLALVDIRGVSVRAAHATVSATLLGTQHGKNLGAIVAANLRSTWGATTANGTLSSTNGRLAGAIAGTANVLSSPGAASFGASIAGTPSSPRVASAFVLSNGRYRSFALNGNAGAVLSNGTLAIRDAALQLGPAFLGADGTIAGLRPGPTLTPRYNLNAQMQTSDLRTLAAQVPRVPAQLVQGSLDAGVHVTGAGRSPHVNGTIEAPEGSVNGLGFRSARATVTGDMTAMSVSGGRVTVGTTTIGFNAAKNGSRTHVALTSPYTDLSDFNDFFDTGDTLRGNGSLALAADLDGAHLESSNGDAFLAGAHFRSIDLGNVAARWQSTHDTIGGVVAFGGESGQIRVAGNVTPALDNPMRSSLDLTASMKQLDLNTWTPMLGLQLPVTGRLNANATIAGRYPDLALNLNAALANATVGRVPVQRFDVAIAGANGRETIRSATLEVPSLTTVASGSFGLRPGDTIAIALHSTSTDIGPFLEVASGKHYDVAAALDSTMQVNGSLIEPHVTDALTLSSLRYANFVVPRIAGTIDVTKREVAIDDGEIDLEKGKVLVSAHTPVQVGKKVTPGSGPVFASFTAQDVELSNAVAFLPKGTQAEGRIDGRVGVDGTIDAPRLNGSLTLANGTFSGPMEKSPITKLGATLAFNGTSATLQNAHATVGGGSFAADGTMSVTSLRSPSDIAFNIQTRADNTRLDMPNYFTGNLTANVGILRSEGGPITIGGNVEVASARVPLTAFFNPGAQKQGPSSLPAVAFSGLTIAVGRDVRVQSANVDIGATGSATLTGTLASPKMSGQFRSTGGTLSFYRTFNITSGTVAFSPSSGVLPDVDATATTFVTNPNTAIRLRATGPVTNMNLALESDPPYNRQQILGLLVGAQQFGAVQGVQGSTASGQFSLPSAATNVAVGQLNTVFTRSVLEPLSSSVGSALGFSDLQITSDMQSGLGLNASKALGKNVTATGSSTIGYPKTDSIAIEGRLSNASSLRLRWYQSQGPTLFNLDQPQTIGLGAVNLNPMTALTGIGNTNGVDLSFSRKFP